MNARRWSRLAAVLPAAALVGVAVLPTTQAPTPPPTLPSEVPLTVDRPGKAGAPVSRRPVARPIDGPVTPLVSEEAAEPELAEVPPTAPVRPSPANDTESPQDDESDGSVVSCVQQLATELACRP